MDNQNIINDNGQQWNVIPPPLNEKKQFKEKISFTSGGLLIYSGIMYIIVFGIMFAIIIGKSFMAGLRQEPLDIENFMTEYSETDMGMSIAVIAGCAAMIPFFWKRIKPKEIFRKHEQKMTVLKFIMLVCVLMCIQLPITFLDDIFENLLNILGFTAQTAIEASQAGSTTISMMLYAGFIGPIAEEFIYRGYTMGSLKNTGAGKGFALVVSSILFGIMHANPTQSVFAFFAGLVFGYTAMEYGVIWSTILHIMNNFIFGDVIVFICRRLPENTANIVDWSLLLVLFVAGVIVLVIKGKSATEYIRSNFRTEKKYYGWTFTNILFWLFVGINVILAVTSISRLE